MRGFLPIRERTGRSGLVSGKVYPQQAAQAVMSAKLDWRCLALNDLVERLNHEGFPCLFGRKASKQASLRLLFCDVHPTARYGDFLSGLTEYTTFVRETPLVERLFSPLVVFFEEAFTAHLPQQHSIAWEALNWVHLHDPLAWPSDVPQNPEHSAWCFCFNGIQLFINISTADHEILRSRNLGRSLTLIINPRKNFDAVASVHTKSGRLIRDRIRVRVASFNKAAVPKELGFYGQTENLEWQQYQLDEDGLVKPSRCPFRQNN